MALMHVQATLVPNSVLPAPGSPLTLNWFELWVSVIDAGGQPVPGLGPADFTVEFFMGGTVPITPTLAAGGAVQPGFYHFECRHGFPGSRVWTVFDYVVSVSVVRGADRGQALTRIFAKDMV